MSPMRSLAPAYELQMGEQGPEHNVTNVQFGTWSSIADGWKDS
jgi:hypothetical protein